MRSMRAIASRCEKLPLSAALIAEIEESKKCPHCGPC